MIEDECKPLLCWITDDRGFCTVPDDVIRTAINQGIFVAFPVGKRYVKDLRAKRFPYFTFYFHWRMWREQIRKLRAKGKRAWYTASVEIENGERIITGVEIDVLETAQQRAKEELRENAKPRWGHRWAFSDEEDVPDVR